MTDRTILIVDDYTPSRYGFRRILAPDGYTFAEAADGAGALHQLGRGVALAIIDVNLPDMSGFELCSRIRKLDGGLPIVLISASYQAVEQHVGWSECGADAFLEQPVEADELRALARKLLNRPREA
jgi:DNA-binding response OmpR family regulator